MLKKLPAVTYVIIMVVFATQLLFSASSGNVTGKVTDATNDQPLLGANIILVGTSMGAAADFDGNYKIQNVPAGTYNLKATYIGYEAISVKIVLKEGEHLVENLKLQPVGVKGKEVVVTAQASGQNAAINQQLSSDNIVNVVSAARIQELPDANAAESVGRLPGVFLVRSYGEGSQISIRGLQPKYNQVLIDGVEMPASDNGDRGVDLSMISSNMLSGIEIYKTVTPDMDAAVLGGTVNFRIREAQKNISNLPIVNLSLQGGYDNLQNVYNNYKFSGSIEKRFFNDKFGVFAQGVIEKKNLTANILGAGYGFLKTDYYNPGPVVMNSLNLTYRPTIKKRYDATLVMDYKWQSGKIDLMNFFSKGDQTTTNFNQNYNIQGNSITYGASYSTPIENVITNILEVKQDLLTFNVDARLSHAYTENINPGSWSVGFSQGAAGVGGISRNQSPVLIAQQASLKANLDKTFFSGINTSSSFTRQRNIGGTIDLDRTFNFSDYFTTDLKFGGAILYTNRSYDYSAGNGSLLSPNNKDARAAVVAANPWMEQSPYNMNANGNTQFPIGMFYDLGGSFGNFLNGDYAMLGHPTNIGLLSSAVNTVVNFQKDKRWTSGNSYSPDTYANIASDYMGYEHRDAAYVMATLNIGPLLTIIPGVRYQNLITSYQAAQIPDAFENNYYPLPFPHTDTTIVREHGYWLPDVSLRYRAMSWFDVRLSYTNTISYPDFNRIIPILHIFQNSVDLNNYSLQPARSQNFDLALSVHDNTIGLFTVNPFLKRIDNLIFSLGDIYITDPNLYGLPSNTRGYVLSYVINNPDRVDLWGVELDWQTHFWYLPGPLSGLVMNINYTHIFSSAQYPFVMTKVGGFPPKTTYLDTAYTDRLIDQPTDIVNLSVGYDYKGFSILGSMIYQDNVFSGSSFWPGLRTHKAKYVRWDLSAKQTLPWFGIEAFFDLNNINGEPDVTIVQGSGFPTSDNSYGMSADLGLRWRLAQ